LETATSSVAVFVFVLSKSFVLTMTHLAITKNRFSNGEHVFSLQDIASVRPEKFFEKSLIFPWSYQKYVLPLR
jgi:hypothetical protein